MTTQEILLGAKNAQKEMISLTAEEKNRVLSAMADALCSHSSLILQANAADIDAAKGKISDVMLDRLMLNEARIASMANGIRSVASLDDPTGKLLSRIERPNGLVIEKVSVPLGVVAIIYESRPNVTADAAALCLKSGNACVLRCGKEAHASARAIVDAMQEGLSLCGLSKNIISLVEDTSRESATVLMRARGLVDLLIPRGGAGLIRACVENALVPCIETGTGICHIYVDKSAEQEMALSILENAKASRPSVCNAAEVCLVHRDIAASFLPLLKKALVDRRMEKGKTPIELYLDPTAAGIISGLPADEQSFDIEFLDYKMAVGVVSDVKDAVRHISIHSTGHSDAILTQDKEAEAYFLTHVDSAAVYVNASTRFTDGGEFGLGCEMGISTQKLHARGPMGLMELTSYKYLIRGNGQIRN